MSRARTRPLDVAQHEAAHVVVGVALGLQLVGATALAEGDYLGCTWFAAHERKRSAFATMYAAGIAWDQALGLHPSWSRIDRQRCRDHCASHHDVQTHVRAAGALLATLGVAHARVTRVLLEHDLGATDVAAIARGEQPAGDPEKS